MTIPTYLINLDRSPHRLAEMRTRLGAIEVAFTRVAAVDGKALTAAEREATRADHNDWLPLTASEIGCFLSHRECWRRIAAGPAAYGCVFEDDMLLSSRVKDRLADASWIPADAEIVKIEEGHNRVWLDMPLRELKDGFRLGRLRSTHYRAGGYIVSREAARRLLAMTERFGLPVDLFLFDVAVGAPSRFVIYQLLPAVAEQKKGTALEGEGGTIMRSGFRHESEGARQRRRYADEFRKLWHRARGRRRLVVGFDPSEG
jgi:glycosyl transferase family 25